MRKSQPSGVGRGSCLTDPPGVTMLRNVTSEKLPPHRRVETGALVPPRKLPSHPSPLRAGRHDALGEVSAGAVTLFPLFAHLPVLTSLKNEIRC